jgi:hypothetical protein
MTPEQFRTLHTLNPEKCSEGCAGFVPDVSGDTQRCDDCWSYYPAGTRPSDADAAALPEARALLASLTTTTDSH